MTHPFISDWGCIQGRIVPKPSFGFPGTLHRTVFPYYGRQVGEVCYVTATYGIEDSLFVQLLQKNEIASSSRQSLTLFITRRNLAQ